VNSKIIFEGAHTMKSQTAERWQIVLAGVCLVTASSLTAMAADPAGEQSIRPAPKLIMYSKEEISAQSDQPEDAVQPPEGVAPDTAAVWRFLAERAQDFSMPSDVSNLKLIATKQSLL
jgi:hypothetical protein